MGDLKVLLLLRPMRLPWLVVSMAGPAGRTSARSAGVGGGRSEGGWIGRPARGASLSLPP